jgi:PAS domain S-box-containing protein
LLDDDNCLRHGATQKLPTAYIELVEGVEIGDGVGFCGTAAWRNEITVVSDIAQDPLWRDYREIALRFNLQACWSFPIVGSSGKVLGVFDTYYQSTRSPQPKELQIIEQIAYLAGIAIERQQAEAAIKTSEARFRQIAETIQEGFFVINLPHPPIPLEQQSYAYINAAYAAITGFPLDTIANARHLWFDNIHPDDQPHMAAVIERQMDGVAYNEEYRYRRPDGELRWLQSQAFSITDEQGVVIRVIGNVRDITDRKQAELALRDSERRYATLAETAPVGIFRFDPTGTLLFVNSYWREFTGRRLEELTGEHWPEFLHPDDRESVLRGMTEAMAQQTEFSQEGRQIHPNGSVQWFSTRVIPEFDLDGDLTGYLGTVIDITDRKQAEARIQEISQRLSLATTSAQIGIWDYDIVADELLWDDRMYDLYGLTRTSTLAPYAIWEDNLHPDDRDRAAAELQATIRGEQDFHTEFRVLWPDGQVRHIEAHAIVTRDAEGNAQRMIGVNWDITSRKQAEAALKKSEADLIAAQSLAHVGNWEFDPETQVVSWSDELYHLYGQDKTQWSPSLNKFKQQVPPEDWELFERAIPQTMTEGIPYSIEHRVIRPDGDIRYAVSKGQAIRSPQGKVVKLFGTTQDITATKQTAMALQASERRYATLAENSPNAVFRLDAEGHCIYVNPRWCEMTGRTVEQGYGDEWVQVLHPEDRDRLMADLQEALAQQKSLRNSGRHLLPDGRVTWFDAQIVPELDSDGNFLGFIGTLVDITDSKRAELALQQLNQELEDRVEQRTQALARSERDLRTIFNNVYDAIFVHDIDGSVLDVNDRALEMSGATRAQLIGASIVDLSGPDAPLEIIADCLSRAQAGATLCLEWQNRRFDDNTAFPTEVTLRQVSFGDRTVLLAGVRDIRDRKRIEAELAESEAKFRRLVEGAQDLIWSVDSNRQLTYLSPQFEVLFGWEASEWLGQLCDGLIHPDDAATVVSDFWQQAAAGQQPGTLEFRHRHRQGHYIWVRSNGTPIFDAEGNFAGIQGIMSDISDRKQAEQALRDAKERYESILSCTIEGFFALNVDDQPGQILEANEAFCQMMGYRRSELLQMAIPDIEASETPADVAAHIQKIKQAGADRFETLLRTKSGRIINAEVSTNYLTHRNIFVSFVRDVTERKQAEAQIHEQEQFLRSIYEGVNQPIFVVDILPDNRIVCGGWNPVAASLMGQPSEAVVGQPIEALFPAQEVAEVMQRYATCIESKQAVVFEESLTMQGQRRWMLSTYNPLIDDTGRVYRIIGTVYDISDRKQAEQAERNAKEQYEAILSRTIEGFCIIAAEHDPGRILETNEAYCQMVGYSRTELLQMGVAELEIQDSPDDIRDRLQQVQQLGATRFETQHRTKTGQAILLEVSVTYLPRQNIFFAFLRDITDRKQAEMALQESRNMLELVLNAIPQRVFWKDRNLRSMRLQSGLCQRLSTHRQPTSLAKSTPNCFCAEQAQSLCRKMISVILSGISRKLNYEEQLDITPTGSSAGCKPVKCPSPTARVR